MWALWDTCREALSCVLYCWEWGRPPVRKRSHNNLFWEEEPAYVRDMEQDTHRERGREAQRGITLFTRMQQLQVEQ